MSGDELSLSYVEESPFVELVSSDVPNPAFLPEGCFQSSLAFNLLETSSVNTTVSFSVGFY